MFRWHCGATCGPLKGDLRKRVKDLHRGWRREVTRIRVPLQGWASRNLSVETGLCRPRSEGPSRARDATHHTETACHLQQSIWGRFGLVHDWVGLGTTSPKFSLFTELLAHQQSQIVPRVQVCLPGRLLPSKGLTSPDYPSSPSMTKAKTLVCVQQDYGGKGFVSPRGSLSKGQGIWSHKLRNGKDKVPGGYSSVGLVW